jgi:hypothetical protein
MAKYTIKLLVYVMAHQDLVHYSAGKGVAHRIGFSVHDIHHMLFLRDAFFVLLQSPERPACPNCYPATRYLKQQMVRTLLAHPGGYFSLVLRQDHSANPVLKTSTF